MELLWELEVSPISVGDIRTMRELETCLTGRTMRELETCLTGGMMVNQMDREGNQMGSSQK
jgi:hypothetical protein